GADKEIRRVSFAGNVQFSSGELTDHIVATPTDFAKRVFRIIGTQRCLRPGLLAADAGRLKSFYFDRGFRDVQVDTVTATHGNWVDILFRIKEGEAVRVASVRLTGVHASLLGGGRDQVPKSKAGP